jgi:hypothetical protein
MPDKPSIEMGRLEFVDDHLMVYGGELITPDGLRHVFGCGHLDDFERFALNGIARYKARADVKKS